MSWTRPADLRAQVQRLWERGELLRASVTEAIEWPLRLTLKAPAAADLAERFEAVRDWVQALAATGLGSRPGVMAGSMPFCRPALVHYAPSRTTCQAERITGAKLS